MSVDGWAKVAMMSGRHVVVVSQPTIAGVAVHVRGQLRAAADSGYSVTVVCPEQGQLSSWASEAGCDVVTLPLTRSPQLADLKHTLTLRRLFMNAHLVHLHSSKAGAIGRLALATMRRTRRPPSIFTPHAWSWLVGGRMAGIFRTIERRLSPVADVTVCVSDGEKRAGLNVIGRRARDLRVVPNGVDTDRFRPIVQRDCASLSPRIVCVGRLAKAKGQDVLLRAFAMAQCVDARLAFVGDGPDEAALRELADELGVDDRIDWFGWVEDPVPRIHEAALVVVPSRWDGMSVALLEAMSCGKPVVATRVSGAEALDDAGVIVPPEDPVALANAVDELIRSPELRRAYGAAARQRVLERYSEQRSTAATLEIWNELLAMRAGSQRPPFSSRS